MNPQPELLIFTKVPELAACKTRLSEVLTSDERSKLMSSFIVDTLELAVKSKFSQKTLATTPETSSETLREILERNVDKKLENLVGKFSLVAQHGSSFAERLNNCLCSEKSIAILGSDAPLLTEECLLDAFEALKTGNSCFGPTTDGGLWLIGVSNTAVKNGFDFCRVFSDHDLLDIEAISREFQRVNAPFRVLRSMSDVDLPEDLAVLKTLLDAKSASEQSKNLPQASLSFVKGLQIGVSKTEANNRKFLVQSKSQT